MEKVLWISLKLNFSPNTLGGKGLITEMTNQLRDFIFLDLFDYQHPGNLK